MKPTDISVRAANPRLALLVAAGIVLLLLGSALVLVNSYVGAGTRVLGFRIGFLGSLLVVFGGAGYVAIGVFESRPGS